MHELGSVSNGATEGLGNGLVTQADAQQRLLRFGSPADGVNDDARFCGSAGAGRDEHAVVFFGELDDFVEVVFVVADDGGLGAELLQVSHEGEDEAIVVVDDKDAGHGVVPALMVDGDVLVEGAILGKVREDVLHEQVDDYEHQHDGDDDAKPQGPGRCRKIHPYMFFSFP